MRDLILLFSQVTESLQVSAETSVSSLIKLLKEYKINRNVYVKVYRIVSKVSSNLYTGLEIKKFWRARRNVFGCPGSRASRFGVWKPRVWFLSPPLMSRWLNIPESQFSLLWNEDNNKQLIEILNNSITTCAESLSRHLAHVKFSK